jgi:predicted proteasome-type protease
VALKLQKLYLSAGFNVFNRTYGEVKYESSVTNEYYQIYPNQNFIESKTETKPTQETKGWLGKPIDPINVFFTVGLVL